MQPDTRPIVAVCLPTGDLVFAKFAICLAAAIYSSRVKIVLIRGQSSIVTIARDSCIESIEAAEAHAPVPFKVDWVWFIDSDMSFPPDSLARLMSHGKDIVAATYVRRYPPHELLGKALNQKPGIPVDVQGGLLEAAGIPLGMALIRRSIFEKLKKPYFRLVHDEELGKTKGEDYLFCEAVRELGYRVWIDFDLTKEVGHIGWTEHKPEVEQAPLAPANGKLDLLRETVRPMPIIGLRPN